MKKFQFNIAYDLLRPLEWYQFSDGQDVTFIFEDDFMAPLRATIIKADVLRFGAGPVVEFEFTDGSHGYSWAFSYGIVSDRNEFYRGAVGQA